jgi:hypothetical protein
MRRLLVASIVAVSVGWLPAFLPVAAQEAAADRFLASAKYVALGYGQGDRFVSEPDAQKSMYLSQEDRAALATIRQQFEKWQRYVLTDFPDHADLLIAVQAGRRGSVVGRAPIGVRQSTSGVGVQVSTGDDVLAVYSVAGGRVGPLVWRKQQSKGLIGSSAPLFEAFRTAVEASSKQPRP